MNNIHSTSASHSASPTSPTFILRPVSLASAISPVSTYSNLSHDEEGIPNGVNVQDPIGEFMIMDLLEHIQNPHIPHTYQAFPIFTTHLLRLLLLDPLPLTNLKKYKIPYVHNSVYHITVSTDASPIILDSAGLDNAQSFFFYLQQMILSRAY